jgi:hypothetical protein
VFLDPLGLEPRCVRPTSAQYIGAFARLHHLERFDRDPRAFNLLWYETDCEDCKAPDNPHVVPSEAWNYAPIGVQLLWPLMNPQIEFREMSGRGKNRRIGVSVQTRFAAWSGRVPFAAVGRFILVCYECKEETP